MGTPQTKYAIRRLAYYGHLAAVSGIALLTLVALLIPEGPNVQKVNAWIVVLFFLFTLYGLYRFVAMPRSVELTADGALKFDSFLATRVLSPKDLRSVSTQSMGYYVVFRFEKAKVTLLNRIDGLYELLSYLKSQQPKLVIKGL